VTYIQFFLIVCLSVTIKRLAVNTAPEITYTVSGGALNSAQSINTVLSFKDYDNDMIW